jgi:hypothetical protein
LSFLSVVFCFSLPEKNEDDALEDERQQEPHSPRLQPQSPRGQSLQALASPRGGGDEKVSTPRAMDGSEQQANAEHKKQLGRRFISGKIIEFTDKEEEKFIQLQCEFEPHEVCTFLKTHKGMALFFLFRLFFFFF